MEGSLAFSMKEPCEPYRGNRIHVAVQTRENGQVEEALNVGFGPPEARTLALLVTYKGRILGERYGPEVDIHSPLEGWSMAKSLRSISSTPTSAYSPF